ncbi:Ig-like domain-containing protein [Haliangium ochraceum]|uniref:SbsA Ig-like domain-containing protein n=1 Tax=Haliangium ochraceum (strain DSM 14365 / JCM 11303 / SMP-2) TaxID=502025 RepID=D0LIM1_HALO1|nr:Ig-like domain-containing protein [Haliangium ochraceum]ACY18377.1 hypothetical protein Hoch_5902 [Haliangium ochraceum DSM 14365]
MSRFASARSSILAAATAALVSAGCGGEDLPSDLDSAGPPRVLTTLVGGPVDAFGATIDVPAYCAGPDEDKLSAACLDSSGEYSFDADQTVTTIAPAGWYIRIVFNELLDGDRAEELIDDGNGGLQGSLANSQPVSLLCNGEAVAYDGYYDAAGTHLSSPPGPALMILPQAQVPTEAQCEVEVVRREESAEFGVFDKGGNAIDSDDGGPYGFTIAPLAVANQSPADGVEGVALDVAPTVTFNTAIDAATLEDGDSPRVALRSGGEPVAATLSAEGATVTLTPDEPLAPQTSYELVVLSGIGDGAGGAALSIEGDSQVLATFTTGGEAADIADAAE